MPIETHSKFASLMPNFSARINQTTSISKHKTSKYITIDSQLNKQKGIRFKERNSKKHLLHARNHLNTIPEGLREKISSIKSMNI